MRRVLVTGGAGYIGSHTCKLLLAHGIEPIVYDDLSSGHLDFIKWGLFAKGDISDKVALEDVFRCFQPDGVIHFAAVASVAESITDPAKYYRNNVVGTLALLDVMRKFGVRKIVFSSSCATYGIVHSSPVNERAPQNPISPYGRTKLIIEQILQDESDAYGLRSASLRYFNAAGADPELEIGELRAAESHIIPRALMAASGRIPTLELMGVDYPTRDGTCVRDFIHVSDLAGAHVLALKYLDGGGGTICMNLGTGLGTSIRELLQVVEAVTGLKVPVVNRPRRNGDPPAIWADLSLASTILGFRTKFSDTQTIISTAWQYMQVAENQRECRRDYHNVVSTQV